MACDAIQEKDWKCREKKELYFSSFSPRGKNNSINILNKHVSAPVRLFIAKLTYCVYARCVRNVI